MGSDDSDIVKFYISATNISYILVNTVKKELNKHLKRHNLNHKHWIVLEMIYFKKANSPTKIADRIGLDISTLSRLLDYLELRLLITREQYKLDGRISVINLTDQGEQQVQLGFKTFKNIQKQIKNSLSVGEQEILEQVEKYFMNGSVADNGLESLDIHINN